MTWLQDMKLRDLGSEEIIEATCQRCQYLWVQSPAQLLPKVDHRDMYLDEVAANLVCPRPGCRHVGAHLTLIHTGDTGGFVGGMP